MSTSWIGIWHETTSRSGSADANSASAVLNARGASPAPVHLDVRAAPELEFDRGDRGVVGVVVLGMQERLDLVLRHIDVVVGRDQPAGCRNHHPPNARTTAGRTVVDIVDSDLSARPS